MAPEDGKNEKSAVLPIEAETLWNATRIGWVVWAILGISDVIAGFPKWAADADSMIVAFVTSVTVLLAIVLVASIRHTTLEFVADDPRRRKGLLLVVTIADLALAPSPMLGKMLVPWVWRLGLAGILSTALASGVLVQTDVMALLTIRRRDGKTCSTKTAFVVSIAVTAVLLSAIAFAIGYTRYLLNAWQ